MRPDRVLFVAVALSVSSGCDQTPTDPSPAMALARPAIHGIVRATNGGPIPDAFVTLATVPSSSSSATRTNESGEFEFGSSALPCSPGVQDFVITKDGFRPWRTAAPGCSPTAAPPPWIGTIRLQNALRVSEQSGVQALLSNDDLDWGTRNSLYEYVCGPCKVIDAPSPSDVPLEVAVEWATADRLLVWFEALGDHETVKLGEHGAMPGESVVRVVMPAAWNAYTAHSIKVGLPQGSRAGIGIPAPITVRVSVRRVN